MNVALHISDTHFGTERPKVVRALERLSLAQKPDVVIFSGDITQRARAAEFFAATSFLDRLAIPSRLVIAGNHDVPLFDIVSRLLWPYARYKRAFGPELEPVLDTPSILVIGVRTTRRYRHIEGEVSARQIDRVARRLQQAGHNQLRVVVTHQPVYVQHDADKGQLLRGHQQAIRSWAEAGADLILGGHIHRPFMSGLHHIDASLPHPVWAVQAGTAVSSRIRHDSNNSINLIRYAFDGSTRRCVIERWDYDEAGDAFTMVASEAT
ncbi:metallophosphoesterase family protein [Pollutimonas harenae]|uniref:Metallophosphoesterase n=1 Tax=Pollutimonas harenae TaxID=657015 RepID=A0A853H1W0_9BURK|nr:metallophosphoesterase [Pollutimonas harenae]NYT85225.1 metallophosphoesterase [Pollutimonas harenae]TEA72404.1 metallophosphoesterase [Pollutimonas harenae]